MLCITQQHCKSTALTSQLYDVLKNISLLEHKPLKFSLFWSITGGPFRIVCDSKFLRVNEDSHLVATSDEKEASSFYIFETEKKAGKCKRNCFMITHYIGQASQQHVTVRPSFREYHR